MANIINERQDLTFLEWSHIRTSSGTAGSFLKSQSNIGGKKKYYKLSNYDAEKGVVGHECINEIIIDRLLTVLGVEHLSYELINADIIVDGNAINTYLCASYDYKKRGESKVALDNYYEINKQKNDSPLTFCRRMGWGQYIDTMLAIDYIILNRDRHGANIEILRNSRAHTMRLAPMFDHGLSLMYSCHDDKSIEEFDILSDLPCNNYIGGKSCFENLNLIQEKEGVFPNTLSESDKDVIFEGLYGTMSNTFINKTWEMLFERYMRYEDLRNN